VTALVLTPFTAGEAVELGNRQWVKKILPVGDVDYKGRTLRFDKTYLSRLVDAFRSRAYDQVPFQLADAHNTHTNDPERTRGEITGMELRDDGLYVTAALTPEGEQVLTSNPKLGVSARIVEEYARSDGKRFTAAIQHVLGTLDPRIPGLGPWEAIEAASPVPDKVLDLSGLSFAGEEPVDLARPWLPSKEYWAGVGKAGGSHPPDRGGSDEEKASNHISDAKKAASMGMHRAAASHLARASALTQDPAKQEQINTVGKGAASMAVNAGQGSVYRLAGDSSSVIELDWAKWDAEHGSDGGEKAHDTASAHAKATARATAKRKLASKGQRALANKSVKGFKAKSASQLKPGHSIVWGNRKTGALEEHKVVSTSRKPNGHVRVTLKGPDGKLHVTSMAPTAQVSYRGAPGDTSLPQVLKQGGFAGLTPQGNPYGLANGTRAALELALAAAPAETQISEGTHGMPDLDSLSDEQKARLAALLELPDDELDALAAGGVVVTAEELEALTAPGEDEDGDEGDDFAAEIAAMTDEEFAAIQAEFEAETRQEEPVAAALSSEAQFAIDLATARADEALREAAVFSARLAEQDYEAEKRRFGDLGVPPFITELARPVLEGAGHVVEMSNGRNVDAGQVMRRVLAEYAKQVRLLDLSAEEGSPFDEPEGVADEQQAKGRDDIVNRFKNATGLH
jgi:hypothetical protein